MPLDPLLSLSPLSPKADTFDPANPNAAHANGFFHSFGSFTYANPGFQLRDQYNNNEIILGWDAVDPQLPLNSNTDNPFRHCLLLLAFQGINVSPDNQYLILFGLRAAQGAPLAQFILGSQIFDTETITGDEQHAVLIDCPGDNTWTQVQMRIATPNNFSDAVAFKGVDLYLL